MKNHFQYLRYVIRHKWFVFIACRKLGVPLWQSIVHDSSKFSILEWSAYVNSFYNKDGSKRYTKTDSGTLNTSQVSERFAYAWLSHQKRNLHHWQAWVLINDEDGTTPLKMPERYVYEMIADWDGAGRAITGKSDPYSWYVRNGHKMILHEETRRLVVDILKKFYSSEFMA